MKVISQKDKITVVSFEKTDMDINDYIKKIILRLKRKYKIDIYGFYEINVYKNKKIGYIIDFIKEDDFDLFSDLLDFKINLYENANIYLKFNDYFLDEKKKIRIYNNCYYIDINDITYKEFLKMIEFSNYVYGNELKILNA